MTTQKKEVEQIQKTSINNVKLIDFRLIKIKEGFNVRHDYGNLQELADSICESGQRVPLQGYSTGNGTYTLTDGHRRYKALELLIEQKRFDVKNDRVVLLPCPAKHSEDDYIFDMFLTNDGKNLNLLEQADLVDRLLKREWDKKDIAKKIGKSKSYIENLILLISAPQALKNRIKEGKISPSMIINIMYNTDSQQEMFKIIEELNNSPEVKKITQSTINKARNIESSLKYFKSIMYASENIKPEMKPTFEICRDIIAGKYSNIEIQKLFLI